MIHYSGYGEKEISAVSALMLDYLSPNNKQYEALTKKYGSKKFMKASIFVTDWFAKQGDIATSIIESKTAES